MEQQGLVKSSVNLPGFVEDAYTTIEKMNEFANMLLESKLVPDHFFEKGPDRKPNYSKGKTASVVIVLLQSQQLGIPPLTGLQQIIPVNGLLSLKGDLCKTMIFASGKLKMDSWVETEEGSIEAGNLKVTITAARSDNGMTLTRSFSIDDAKRAGLWVSETDIQGNDGWKKKASAWWKHAKRMLGYRALGFISRDLFSDVILNMYTTEEALDIPKDESIHIPTESGATITIQDKSHSQQRSEALTGKASKKFDKAAAMADIMPEKGFEAPQKQAEMRFDEEAKVVEETIEVVTTPVGDINKVTGKPIYTEEELMDMEVGSLNKVISADRALFEAMNKTPGKNTHKKLRILVLMHQAGKLAKHCDNYGIVLDALSGIEEEKETIKDVVEPGGFEVEGGDVAPLPEEEVVITKENAPEVPENVTKDFPPTENKFDILVTELEDGKREFGEAMALYNELGSVAGLDNKMYINLISTKFPELHKFADREAFVNMASKAEINNLLNSLPDPQ